MRLPRLSTRRWMLLTARAEQPSTQKKLHQAGADHVVVPAAIGAHRMVSLLTNPAAVEFAELVTTRSSLAIEMDEFPVHAGSPLIGLSMREADIGRRTVVVVAIFSAEFVPIGSRGFDASATRSKQTSPDLRHARPDRIDGGCAHMAPACRSRSL